MKYTELAPNFSTQERPQASTPDLRRTPRPANNSSSRPFRREVYNNKNSEEANRPDITFTHKKYQNNTSNKPIYGITST